MSNLLYINLVPSAERIAFEQKVKEVASKLQTNPNWLMQIMKSESGLRPDIQNTSFPMSNGYATGLIQFIPDTAANLGTTTAALKQMSRVQQMDYVYKYLKPYAGQLNSYFDVYLVVFFPAAIGNTNNDNYIFETNRISRASIARGNPTMDINKDGMITMAEFKQYLKNTVKQEYWNDIFMAPVVFVKNNLWMVLVLAVLAMGITFAIIKISSSKKS